MNKKNLFFFSFWHIYDVWENVDVHDRLPYSFLGNNFSGFNLGMEARSTPWSVF
jgi:hypothetical protein